MCVFLCMCMYARVYICTCACVYVCLSGHALIHLHLFPACLGLSACACESRCEMGMCGCRWGSGEPIWITSVHEDQKVASGLHHPTSPHLMSPHTVVFPIPETIRVQTLIILCVYSSPPPPHHLPRSHYIPPQHNQDIAAVAIGDYSRHRL